MKIKDTAKKIKEKVKAKVAAKCAKKAKRKTGKSLAELLLIGGALTVCGCLGTTQPSRSQNLTIRDCAITIYGGGADTNGCAAVEIATQAMAIETSGTETQTATPTQTTDTKPDIDVTVGGKASGTAASGGILENAVNKLLGTDSTASSATTDSASTASGTTDGDCADGSCTL